MIIRTAEKSDARALSELATETYVEAFGHSFSAADLAAELAANVSYACFERYLAEDTILIAQAADRMVGFVQFGVPSLPVEGASAEDRELRRLYVHPSCQRRGIGTRLMDAAFAHPRLKAARNVYLDVWERNDGAQALYRRYGFDVVGTRRFEVASGIPADLDLIMVRRSAP